MKKTTALILLFVLMAGWGSFAQAKVYKKVYVKKVVKKAAKKPVKKTITKTISKTTTSIKTHTTNVNIRPAATVVVVTPATAAAPVAPAPAAAPKAASSRMAISPKVGLGTGGLNSFGVGCEFNIPVIPSVDVMLEAGYWPVSGAPIIMIGGNGIYKFAPVEGMSFSFYSGGGLFYQMVNVTGATGSINAFGFQVLGGADIPIPGAGNAFAQMKYGIANYTYTIGAVSFSASSGGFVLEGGYRFLL